ncbi:MAG: hypothetical protein OXM61_23440 [Candidatus Poribacteria bacterium]|nr:hypothetical protein [Candidatus Poribacteria bacterium]
MMILYIVLCDDKKYLWFAKQYISNIFTISLQKSWTLICAEEEKTVNEVLADALNSLFVNKGKAPIA